MNTPAYILTDESITVVVHGKPYTANKSNASFNEIKKRLIARDFAGIESLFDTAKAVTSYTKGRVTVVNNAVLYNGVALSGIVTERILQFMRGGLPYQPLVNFLEKLMQNPSRRAVSELYKFLEHRNMPITPDGNFLAYKGVQTNFYSVRSGHLTLLKGQADGANNTGHIYNGVGEEVECPRNEVCDNFRDGCAAGLHIGSLEYATGWGAQVIICEINPADVVAVPEDCSCQKMRCCHYKVVGLFERALTEPMVGEYVPEPEEVEATEALLQADAELVEGSYQEGYQCGNIAAANGGVRNPETAIEFTDPDGNLDEDAFIEGYHAGYDDFRKSAPVVKVVSDATRRKLRQAALRQPRGNNGRFV